MKRILISAAAATSFFAMAVAPASAAPWQSINQRQAHIEHSIDQGVRNGSLTRSEATRLRGEFRDLARLETRYRSSNGLSMQERRDLDRRFDRLSAQVRYERNDNQRRY
jgi:hypothetical protein